MSERCVKQIHALQWSASNENAQGQKDEKNKKKNKKKDAKIEHAQPEARNPEIMAELVDANEQEGDQK